MLNNEIKNIVYSPYNFGQKILSLFYSSISIDEALKILDISKKDNLTISKLNKKYQNLLSRNNPYKSGSFYIQNKIYNAKQKLLPLCKNVNLKNYSLYSISNDLIKFKILKKKLYL